MRISSAFVLFALLTPSAGQAASDAGDSAARSASDAFGEKVGIDSVGLYSENGARGFDLIASSSAYRIDGFYFQPGSTTPESLLQGSSVKVGIAATALDLPSPTGVVAYRLREPAATSGIEVTSGWRDASPHLSAQATLIDRERGASLVTYGLYEPSYNETTGGVRPYVTGAAVARWQPDPGTKVEAFTSYIGYWHHGDISVLPDGPGVPPPLRRYRFYGPDWSRTSYEGATSGVLATRAWGAWSAALGAVHSTLGRRRSDVDVLAIDSDGHVRSTLFYTPPFSIRSDSIEAKLAREVRLLGIDHRIGLAVRGRETRTGRAEAMAYDQGDFLIGDAPPDTVRPDLPATTAQGSDRVRQRIVSFTYDLDWRDRIRLRLGAHASRYAKAVAAFDGSHARSVEKDWLFSGSLIWQPTPRFRLFASRVSGLEETGAAPNAALNRGEVPPPVKARQTEIGARYEVTPGLNLIVAGFDIAKPTYGLRPDNIYAPIGTVRHRGIEASLTGRVGAGTTLVVGGNLLQPRLSGPSVDAGMARKVAPGVSRVNATFSIDQQLAPGWSADLFFLYEGPRRRDQTSTTEVPGVPFATVGTRYSWTWGRTPLSLRAQAINALNRRGYYAVPYGGLVPISPIDGRLLLTVSF
jgi:iron complex outermembrane receptor protein